MIRHLILPLAAAGLGGLCGIAALVHLIEIQKSRNPRRTSQLENKALILGMLSWVFLYVAASL